jgi:hypothetical protein
VAKNLKPQDNNKKQKKRLTPKHPVDKKSEFFSTADPYVIQLSFRWSELPFGRPDHVVAPNPTQLFYSLEAI